jgi:hypothetical protein
MRRAIAALLNKQGQVHDANLMAASRLRASRTSSRARAKA